VYLLCTIDPNHYPLFQTHCFKLGDDFETDARPYCQLAEKSFKVNITFYCCYFTYKRLSEDWPGNERSAEDNDVNAFVSLQQRCCNKVGS